MLDLKIKTDLVEVTNKDKEFKGTDYEGETFKIFFKRMNTSDQYDILEKNEQIEASKSVAEITRITGEMFDNIFLKKVEKITGLKNNGKELTCESEDLIFLTDNASNLVTYSVLAYKRKLDEEEAKKEEDKKK